MGGVPFFVPFSVRSCEDSVSIQVVGVRFLGAAVVDGDG